MLFPAYQLCIQAAAVSLPWFALSSEQKIERLIAKGISSEVELPRGHLHRNFETISHLGTVTRFFVEANLVQDSVGPKVFASRVVVYPQAHNFAHSCLFYI